MTLRSILFVPGDSERKLARALECPADAIILDLEDSVMPDQKAKARSMVREALAVRAGQQQYWVRINSFDSGQTFEDLAAVVGGRPDALLLPKANDASDLEKLHYCLLGLEARESLPSGHIKVAVVATETGNSIFNLGTYTAASPRLLGLTWGAEDLGTAVGAISNSDENGALTPLYVLARSLCLAAAGASQSLAIDTAFMSIKDTDALRANCLAARRDGFRAKLAIHPDQVAVINDVFAATQAEIEEADRIVALFAANPTQGAFNLDGRMIDIPHLKQAQQLLSSQPPSTAGRALKSLGE